VVMVISLIARYLEIQMKPVPNVNLVTFIRVYQLVEKNVINLGKLFKKMSFAKMVL